MVWYKRNVLSSVMKGVVNLSRCPFLERVKFLEQTKKFQILWKMEFVNALDFTKNEPIMTGALKNCNSNALVVNLRQMLC